MRKSITSILALVAMMFATSVSAQTTFTGSADVYPSTSEYDGKTIMFSLSDIATALGTDTATLVKDLNYWRENWNIDSLDVKSIIYNVPNDTVKSDNYTTGEAGGFWMDSVSVTTEWTNHPFWFSEVAWNANDDAFEVFVGQMPNVNSVGDSYSTTLLIDYNNQTVNLNISINFVERPKLNKEPVNQLSKLTIAGSSAVTITQYPRTNYNSDSFTIDVAGLAEKLGLDPELITVNLDTMLFAKTYDSTNETINDSLSAEFTANPTPGFWYIKTFDENTGEEGPEVVQGGYDTSNDIFYIASIAYAKTDTSETISGILGQCPGVNKAGDSRYGYFYIVYGDKAYEIKVTLNLAEEPERPFKDMEMIGEEDHDFEIDHDAQYSSQPVGQFDINLDSIVGLLGVEQGEISLQFLADENNLNGSNTTANNGGCWLDTNGFVIGWGSESTCLGVEPASTTDFTSFTVYCFNSSNLNDDEVYKAPVLIVANNKYYRFNVSLKRQPKVIDPDAMTVEKCEVVGTYNYEYQIVPNANYQDYEYQDAIIDVDINKIKDLLGTSTFEFYGEAYPDSLGNTVYSKTYSCDPNPGFWMSLDTLDANGHHSVVSNWGATRGSEKTNINTYGICYANGQFSFYQFPGVPCATVGNYYTDNFYLVSLSTGKKIKYTITVRYVEELTKHTTAGSESLTAAAREEEGAEYGRATAVDLTPMYTALGCTQEEFENAGTWVAPNQSGTYTSDNYDAAEGFYFDANGKTVDDGSEVMHVGINEEGELYSWVIDNDNLDNTYTVTFAALYNDQMYYYTVTVNRTGAPTAINGIGTDVDNSGAIYDLTGRKISKPNKGIYIQNGKKYLAK